MEFLDAGKAKYFAETYKEVVPRHHMLFVIEADKGGLAQIARDNAYKFEISEANSRGQAVGFLINDRLKVNGTKSYAEVANVNNIPDLRPAFRVDFTDSAMAITLASANRSAIIVQRDWHIMLPLNPQIRQPSIVTIGLTPERKTRMPPQRAVPAIHAVDGFPNLRITRSPKVPALRTPSDQALK
jgi:hypothetical protein